TYTASDALTAGAATGTYTWSATYSGDGNNLTAPDQGGATEQTVVNSGQVGVGALTQGFWKNHPSAWKVTSLTIGGTSYTQNQLIQILQTPTGGNAALILAHQLIAAMLNVANGAAESGTTAAKIADASTLLNGINLLSPTNVSPSSSLGAMMIADAD